jgi:hypothetical protein
VVTSHLCTASYIFLSDYLSNDIQGRVITTLLHRGGLQAYYYRGLPYDPVRPWKDTDGKWYSAWSTDGCNGTNQFGPTPAENRPGPPPPLGGVRTRP